MKKNTLRLSVLAILYAGNPAIAGEVTFDGTLAPQGGRAAATLPATNGTYTINQSDGVLRGGNLFHSFGKFNLDTGETGLFTTSSAGVQNVISRVTGGQQSTINGTLRLSADRNTNLFFINPSGVVFGENALVDLPGSFYVSTATNLTFADGAEFDTRLGTSTVLTAASPQSFGFLSDKPMGIIVENANVLRSTLFSDNGMGVFGAAQLVGGDIDIKTSTSVRILFPRIASVASPGNVPVDLNDAEASAAAFEPFARLGTVRFSGGGSIRTDIPSVFAGSIELNDIDILGGISTTGLFLLARDRLEMNQASLGSFEERPVNIRSSGSVVIANNSSLFSLNGGGGTLQQVCNIDAADITITDSRIDVELGNGVSLRASGELKIERATIAADNAQAITLVGKNVSVTDSTVNLRNNSVPSLLGDPRLLAIGAGATDCIGSGCISTENVTLRNSQIRTSTDVSVVPQDRSLRSALGRSADIKIAGQNVIVDSSAVEATTDSRDVDCRGCDQVADLPRELIVKAGAITVAADRTLSVMGDITRIAASTTGVGDAGAVSLSAPTLMITGGTIESRASLVPENVGKPLGTAGTITLTADRVALGKATISTDTATGNPDALPASINITSRQADLTLDGTQISATTSSTAAAGSVALNSNSTISLVNGATLSTTTTSTGGAGNISLAAVGNVSLSGANTTVSSSSSGTGAAGSIQLGTQAQRLGGLTIDNGATIQASTSSSGAGGSISGFVAGNAVVSGPSRISASTTGSGDAGGVSLSAARLEVSGGTIESRSTASVAGQESGTAGSVALDADRLILGAAAISTDTASTQTDAAAASITLSSRDELRLTGTQVTATSATSTAAGSITLTNTGGAISLQDGATVASTTNSVGAAGNIAVVASGNVTLLTGAAIRSESVATTSDAGRAGTINVTADAITVDGSRVLASINGGNTTTATADVALTARTGNIDLRNRAQITADTSGAAAGGNVTFTTPGTVSLADAGTNVSSSATGSGIAGNIQIGTATQRIGGLKVANGAAVQVNTSGSGKGGAINVLAAGDATLTGAGSTLASNATDAGNGGTIHVDATNVRLADGARIQSTAMGSGDSGAITLAVVRDLRLTDGAPESFATQTGILTSAQQSSGGNITATVGGNVLLASSRIESSVATAAGKGGDISLLTQGLLLSSSQIFARADQGNGGGITITRRDDLPPGPFLIDANSSISAQSRAAVSGVIAVDSTDTNVNTVIDPLAATLAQAPALAANPCSARQSGAPSTFVRDTDGGVSPLPDSYFTAGVLANPSATRVATTSSEKITLAALVGANSPCAR